MTSYHSKYFKTYDSYHEEDSGMTRQINNLPEGSLAGVLPDPLEAGLPNPDCHQ